MPRPSRYAPDALARAADWSADAACKGWDTELFYAPVTDPDTRQAKAICRGCPVLAECLADAMARAEPYGVWGGVDEDERGALIRRRRAAARKQERKR
ncbi:WhiB family transcriptional regulator [Streptomyces sp. TRM68367]|uniref:WhiB family transcriptional regulator n=1 Tax=Streptomyces sp. TRM68367 TaxID=2758415 RepID=UPI00165BEE4B|nr:WhiB family transcriptional regulator [Streptomyces sp. TRM68367]MBC9729900.1 WhiB family transcriptional regulator [Streptomyces sp. TRM68367]